MLYGKTGFIWWPNKECTASSFIQGTTPAMRQAAKEKTTYIILAYHTKRLSLRKSSRVSV